MKETIQASRLFCWFLQFVISLPLGNYTPAERTESAAKSCWRVVAKAFSVSFHHRTKGWGCRSVHILLVIFHCTAIPMSQCSFIDLLIQFLQLINNPQVQVKVIKDCPGKSRRRSPYVSYIHQLLLPATNDNNSTSSMTQNERFMTKILETHIKA